MALQEILLTSFLTIVAGSIVFVIGHFFLKLIIEPFDSLRKVIIKARESLVFYADVYSNPGITTPESRKETSRALRNLSAEIIGKMYEIRVYNLFRNLKLIPSQKNLIEAHKELMGLSNSVNDSQAGESNRQRREKIESLLDP